MLKFILSFCLILSIVSSDIVLEVLLCDDYNICLSDNPMEGESEQEGKEDMKEESKINIDSHYDLTEARRNKLQSNIHFYFQLSDPFLEHFSPPPEYI